MQSISYDQLLRLFEDDRQPLISFLVARVRCRETAEDLSQEAYLRLLGKDGVAHTGNLAAYLYRTAERLAIDFLRQHNRLRERNVALADGLACSNIQPEDLAILQEQCEILFDTIASLPRVCRHVFLLRKIDELSYAEISTRLGISGKTVQRHLVKAMLHCHRRLENPFA